MVVATVNRHSIKKSIFQIKFAVCSRISKENGSIDFFPTLLQQTCLFRYAFCHFAQKLVFFLQIFAKMMLKYDKSSNKIIYLMKLRNYVPSCKTSSIKMNDMLYQVSNDILDSFLCSSR